MKKTTFSHIYCKKTRTGAKNTKADKRSQNGCVLSRHSGMPVAGNQSGVFLDSGQNRAGMTGR